jgi:hypothetical protein
MKKIIVIGPVLSRSGYGEMARNAVKSLLSKPDLFDVYVQATPWGSNASIVNKNNPDFDLVNSLIQKTTAVASQNNNQIQVDVSIQVSLPTDWKKIAAYNIGYTAGIETNYISSAWLQPSNEVDKIIVISEHAKSGFTDTVFGDQQGNQYRVNTPVDVVHFPVKEYTPVDLGIDLEYDFNFLSICQWGPRKNLEQTIVNFIEEFKDEEVGLIVKTNMTSDGFMDKEACDKRIDSILKSFPDRKCKVYLLHGYMSEQEIHSLYTHPKVKAIVSSTHGEGFGLPLFEATYSELPVVATDWSGHLDFLTMPDEQGKDKKMFGKVDYELKEIAQEHVWNGVLEAGTKWAYPKPNSLKMRMREVFKDYPRFKSWAKKLAKYNKEKFTDTNVYNSFLKASNLYKESKKLKPQPIDGISLCIPTNAKRSETTRKTISSIKKQNWKNIPFEIILCGDVESYKDIEGVTLIDKKEDCHNRKVSALRNTSAEASKYNNIVFCDDDVVLTDQWLENITKYSEENGWEVLGNKIQSPDGTRYWDRATITPHILVSYDHPSNDTSLYQTSTFFMVRKETFKKCKWDETKLVYADREGGTPEDLQYSLDLIKGGFELSFCKDALVWHADDKYTEYYTSNFSQTLTKDILKEKLNYEFFLPHDEDFKKLIESL